MKFRKKPIVIEAYQTDEEMIIQTLEGPLRAAPPCSYEYTTNSYIISYEVISHHFNHYQIRNEVYNIVINGSIYSILITVAADTFF